MIQYLIKVDMQSSRVMYTDIELTSGDYSAYQLVFTFYSNGIIYPAHNHTLVVKAKRADGTIIVDQGEVTEKGQGAYTLASNAYAIPGELTLEVALGSDDGGYVTTKELVLQVRDGYGDGDLTGENTTPILAKMVEQITKTEQATQEVKKLTNITVSAVQLEAGEPAYVTKHEDANSLHFSFGIAKGEKMSYSDLTKEDKEDLLKDCVGTSLYTQDLSLIHIDINSLESKTSELEQNMGNVEVALDNIITHQNDLIGGGSV